MTNSSEKKMDLPLLAALFLREDEPAGTAGQSTRAAMPVQTVRRDETPNIKLGVLDG